MTLGGQFRTSVRSIRAVGVSPKALSGARGPGGGGSPPREKCTVLIYLLFDLSLGRRHYVRRQGRPNREWIPEVKKEALSIVGSWERLQNLAHSKQVWNDTLCSHFNF